MPPAIAVLVVFYQLVVVRGLHSAIPHLDEYETIHYSLEIILYGIAGPLVTWAILGWIRRWLQEKERVERQMQERERYLASITEGSADAIISLDGAKVIRSWNYGAGLLFGYRAEQIIGQSLERLFPPDLIERGELQSIDYELRTNRQGILRNYEAEMINQAGERFPVELTFSRLTDEVGQITGSAVIIRDISERVRRDKLIADERARIARELHEGVAQNLFFAGLKTDLCRKLVMTEPERADQELQIIKSTLQEGIADLRRFVLALRPIDLEQLGLVGSLRKLSKEFGEQNGLQVELTLRGLEERKLPTALDSSLFRIIQEALNNVDKHAEAHRVWITLALDNGTGIKVEIRDDGRGFSPDEALKERSGLGLVHLRERVEERGGIFTIASQPGVGTTLSVSIPLQRTNGAEN
jgi:PAS domain S-box-containing protein